LNPALRASSIGWLIPLEGTMLGIARTRRAVAGSALAMVMLVSVATPVVAGDDLVVQPGDTLWDIALEHGTTVDALAALNGLADPSFIQVGQRIVLRPPSAPAAAPPAPAAAPEPLLHVVEPDQTLWSISLAYGTSVPALVELNQIENPSLIRIGQVLAIPQPAAASVPTAPSSATPTVAQPGVHVVQAGETLWAISSLYGLTVQALADANLLADASFIRTGQSLVIPGVVTDDVWDPSAVTTASMPSDMAAKVAQRTEARALLLAAASEFGLSGPFVLAVAWHESGWQLGAVSFAGAVGLMQLVPDTADWVAGSVLDEAPALDDPQWNARAGVRLLGFYLDRYQGDKARTLAAYFQGMTSVDEIGILETTQPYIDSILTLEQIFSR
jgi:LysM repeat protein